MVSQENNLHNEIIIVKDAYQTLYHHINTYHFGNWSAGKDLLKLGISELYRNDMKFAEQEFNFWVNSHIYKIFCW